MKRITVIKGNSVVFGNENRIGGSQTEINVTSMKVYNGQEDKEERQSKNNITTRICSWFE
jgi:hypothetical protein